MEAPSTWVRRERQALQLTTRDLATLAGVSYPTISRIEQGHAEPQWHTLAKIASALGASLATDLTTRPVPRIADLATRWSLDAHGSVAPDWLQWRALVDQLSLHPELVGVAISAAPARSGSPLVDNLIAATAEKLADDAGIRRPAWTRQVEPLTDPWVAPGTPRKQAEFRKTTPPQFGARNMTLPATAIWRNRQESKP